jgi:predicted dehydrogenase
MARERGVLLLVAPAVMATQRFRWLRDVVASEKLGRATLATGHFGNLGPAAWREYTGDPRVHYGEGVGPLVDQGVYLLHAMTGLLGPVRRLQAMATIAMPQRTVTGGPHIGEHITLEAPDHVLLQLEFERGVLGHVLSSFAIPGTRAPLFELHFERGSVSIKDDPPLSANGTVSISLRDESDLGIEGWLDGVAPSAAPSAVSDLIGAGVEHFLVCLGGAAEPLLTAEDGAHVLQVIEAAEASAATGADSVLS